MIEYAAKYHYKLTGALLQHIEMVAVTLILSVVLAVILTIAAMMINGLSKALINLFSMVYSIPSLAIFAILIPVTGLGKTTAIIVMTVYNQYLLLRSIITGLNEVEPAIVEAAVGMGMSKMQVLYKIRLPLSKRVLITGIRVAAVSTVGTATIAAAINAGGLGDILFDGLRTMNVYKIIWGSFLSAGLVLCINSALSFIEKRI